MSRFADSATCAAYFAGVPCAPGMSSIPLATHYFRMRIFTACCWRRKRRFRPVGRACADDARHSRSPFRARGSSTIRLMTGELSQLGQFYISGALRVVAAAGRPTAVAAVAWQHIRLLLGFHRLPTFRWPPIAFRAARSRMPDAQLSIPPC